MKREFGFYDRRAVSLENAIGDFDESKTVQADAEDADINNIVRKFGVTGKLPENVREPQYGDFLDVTDYRSALEALRAAQDSFMQMPAELRAQLGNDPAEFLDWCADPANAEAKRKYGLVVEPEPAPVAPATTPSGG